MELFNYYRSSASWRVRIALALKGLAWDYRPIHLLKDEQHGADFVARQPSHLVPLLRDGDAVLGQSLAILEYLDETHPEPPLLPAGAIGRAQVRALAQDIACETHPLNNLRVLRYLTQELGQSEEAKMQWIRHWIETGLEVVEQKLAAMPRREFCFGDVPGLADCVLVPQVFSAQRFEARLDHLPQIMRIHANCMAHPAFDATQPSKCPDAQ